MLSWRSRAGRESVLLLPCSCLDDAQLMGLQVFKSAMMPLGISFLTNTPQPDVKAADRIQYKYRIIFKDGDDLRQDQLVLQMLRLMDR